MGFKNAPEYYVSSVYTDDARAIPAHCALAGATIVECLLRRGESDASIREVLDILSISADSVREGRKSDFYKAVKEARCGLNPAQNVA